jgi:hypothetical protein
MGVGNMGEELLPIMISTYEGLCKCLEEDVQVIYIWNHLYKCQQKKIDRALTEGGYVLLGVQAHNGLFFVKKGKDFSQMGFSDPYDVF